MHVQRTRNTPDGSSDATLSEEMPPSSKRAEAHVDRLLDELHRSRLRVWSIVISFFGDAITPRGGVLWLSTFRPLAARLGIESGTVGAAMSRLTADGWLVREKRGRHTFYRLDDEGQSVFDRAARRIYGLDRQRPWKGRWSILIVPEERAPPDGYVRIDSRTWVRPESAGPSESAHVDEIVFSATADVSPAMRALIHEAWHLDAVGAAYDRWRVRFSPLHAALTAGDRLSPLSAMCARLLLIHDFRRVVLKDPELPDALRPSNWPGFQARQQAADMYRALLTASEAWLDAPDITPAGPLPKPKPSFFKRFGGLRGKTILTDKSTSL